MPDTGPQLTEFIRGFPGPAAAEYRGGAVRVIAALIYGDGVLIEWLVGPMPDLSWISDPDEATPERQAYIDKLRDQPGMIERLRESRRLSVFWDDASLVDDVGGKYVSRRGGGGLTGRHITDVWRSAPGRRTRRGS